MMPSYLITHIGGIVIVSARSLLVPGAALAAAGVLALTPAVVAPSAPLAAPAVTIPTVHIDNVALAGIGRDFYNNAVLPTVQYGVQWAQYAVGFIPYIGPPIADQIGINYFNLIQPLVANTVYVLSDIVADPFNLPGWINSYLINQAYVGIGYVNAQAQFFGAPPVPPFPFPPAPPLATTRSAAPSASATPGTTARQAARQAAAVAPSRPSLTRPARAAASTPRRDTAGAPAAARSAASVARGGEARQGARSAAARSAR